MGSVCSEIQDAKTANIVDARIAELSRLGKTWKDIAVELNISERTVRYKAKALGLGKRKSVGTEELHRLAADGVPDREMAARLGVSLRTIKRLQKGNGVRSAVSHGGRRANAGRKAGVYHNVLDARVLLEQQRIDCLANSMDAGIRTSRGVSAADWLRWAGSAYRYNRARTSMVAKSKGICSFGMPRRIAVKGSNYLPGDLSVEVMGGSNHKAGKANATDVQAMNAARGN